VEQETASLRSAPRFLCADAIEHLRRCASGSLGCVVTERFLLNLPSAQLQRAVIRDAYRALTPGGRLLMCEGSNEGFRALNGIRESVGLAPIPETSADNVTALRFDDRQIEDFAQREVGFRLVGKRGFSQFFIISRVLHPLLAAPLPPRFDARINDLARRVQEAVPDEPGVGANTLWMLEKPQA
jgi:SAM-dependent methyltransferase